MRFSLYVGSEAKRNEKTPISTMNMHSGFRSAHKNPPKVPWYRALKSVRTSVQIRPALSSAGRRTRDDSSAIARTGLEARSVPADAFIIARCPGIDVLDFLA